MSEPIPPFAPQPFAARFTAGVHELRRNWGWFLVLGIALIVLGMLALGVCTVLTTLLTVLFLGWLLLVEGVLHAVIAFWAREWSGFFLHFLAGLLSVIVGLLMLTRPERAALALTLLLAIFFLVSGVFWIISALMLRYPSWGWTLLSGAVNLLLGLVIWSALREDALQIIGILVGVNMLFNGWSYVAFALALRSVPNPGHSGP